MEIYLLGQRQLVPIFVSVVGHSDRNTEWVFWVFSLKKNYLFFCLPLQTDLQGRGFHNPGEVLEVVILDPGGRYPNPAVLMRCCRNPAWSLDIGVSWVELEMSLTAECKTTLILPNQSGESSAVVVDKAEMLRPGQKFCNSHPGERNSLTSLCGSCSIQHHP